MESDFKKIAIYHKILFYKDLFIISTMNFQYCVVTLQMF